MYILTNALANVWRNRSRNLLIAAMMLVVIATSVIAMMISTTSASIIDDYKSRFSSEVQFQPDFEQLRAQAQEESEDGRMRLSVPTITAEQYEAFGDSDLLAGTDYTATTGIVPTDLTVVDADLGGSSGMGMVRMGPGGEEEEDDDAASVEPLELMAQLIGGTEGGETYAGFEDGTRQLAEGEFPDAVGEVIVSSELAELNDLTLGDSFTAAGQLINSEDDSQAQDVSYELTVVGIYDDASDEYGDMPMQNAYANTRNQILTTYETVAAVNQDGYRGINVSATYYLSNPDDLEAFEAEVRAEGLDEIFSVTTDEASYEQIVGPVEGLKSISSTFMWVVLILGAVIVALLSSIAIRERKYEIGVLRAMGLKKSKVALGLWFESMAVTAACLVAGLGIGTLVAQPITNALLAGQVEAAEAAQSAGMTGGPGGGGAMMLGSGGMRGGASTAEPLSQLDVVLTPAALGQIALVAIGLASLVALIAILRITKFEPMKILAERN